MVRHQNKKYCQRRVFLHGALSSLNSKDDRIVDGLERWKRKSSQNVSRKGTAGEKNPKLRPPQSAVQTGAEEVWRGGITNLS